MAKFRNKSTGRVWEISNTEHLKHFRANPRFEEVKENKKVEKQPKKEEKTTEE